MHDAVVHALKLPEIEATPLPSEHEVAKFDLTLAIEHAGDAYALQWEYSNDLFNLSTLARMASHFEMLLSAALLDPERPLELLPMAAETAASALAGPSTESPR